ncbi:MULTISPECIES: helix-turn-helix domain-containing protein [unclassified Cupriavidus]|uniref:helix-turn-helix domain-containing protein n=1 Tax=Cupriavidus TaxID=106589 RepID=UPI002270A2B9|nr:MULTISPECIES: helix-turn-helix transcriptional regulator [unclassified Cupriavidus]MCY0857124.1 helix-turn-helix transcriptional regulator [Cupriavidus sp. D39]MDW3681091.1 helix-turn-helix transcriptional regulator [Cupriavidus sp. CV2]
MPIASPRHGGAAPLVQLGNAIREVRLRQDLSQEELAHRAGIDRSYMSSVERGGQNLGVMHLLRIATALEVTVAELMAVAKL